jgi:putative methionine-R-sulfoxide reductase with GAF domain
MLKISEAVWDRGHLIGRPNSSTFTDTTETPLATEVIHQVHASASGNFDIGLEIAVRAAQQRTGAAAAALALIQGNSLVCRARVGEIVPDIGIPLNPSVGITGACFRTGEVLYCADTETDSRVDSSLCRRLGIRSVLVVPILENQGVTGLIEVLSSQYDAFDATHVRWLLQLSQFIQALARSAKLSPAQTTTTPARTESVPQTLTEGADAGQPRNSAKPALSRLADYEETELSVIRDVLHRSVGTATWDDIGQQLISRLRTRDKR